MTMDTKLFTRILFALFALLAIAAMGLFASCKSPEKAANYLKKKDALAGICAAEYPVKEKTIFKAGDTVIKEIVTPGITITKRDTVISGRDTIYRITEVVCPPSKERIKIVHDSIFIMQENTARIAQLKSELEAKERNIQAVTQAKNKSDKKLDYWWIVYVLGLITIPAAKFIIKFFA